MSETHRDFSIKSNARRTARKMGLDPASVKTIVKAGEKIYRLPLTPPEPEKPAKVAKPKREKIAKTPKPAKAKAERAPRQGGEKFAAVADMLRQPGGASITSIMAATGWLGHTARARISKDVSKLLNKGEVIQRTRPEKGGKSVYAIVPDKQMDMGI